MTQVESYAILISSCEKFSDLWEENVRHLKKNWKGKLPRIVLVSDGFSSKKIPGVEIVWYEGNMPFRLKQALSVLDCDYMLVTLDDYFLLKETQGDDIEHLVQMCEKNSIHYLQLYHRRKSKKLSRYSLDDIERIDLTANYAVCLYPAIWERKFLDYCIKEDLSPWEFEPKLTGMAKEYAANCYFCRKCCFYILDVVRKGKILHKAKKYFKRNKINIGDRQTISYATEIKLTMADLVSVYLPKPVYCICKNIAKKMGYKFFSDCQ